MEFWTEVRRQVLVEGDESHWARRFQCFIRCTQSRKYLEKGSKETAAFNETIPNANNQRSLEESNENIFRYPQLAS